MSEIKRRIRIGIDVGGTFTDAVAIDEATYDVIGSIKIPTTHDAETGVAAGIVYALREVMKSCNISADDIVFIAHGTTQATNALLEGDVAKVGIITLGTGVGGVKSKSDTNVGKMELAAGKFLYTDSAFVDTASEEFDKEIEKAIIALKQQGCETIVAAEAFSVDNPENENNALEICNQMNIPGTVTNEISKLYGLKMRTRTAVVNASILPKMLGAANMTEKSIKDAMIQSPLMVMRCDGGVMTVEEVRKRPIMTILSGPAAGVAGALMYEKLTDGLFFEVGGTSTDISCVKDGKVMIRYAEVGGHKTYLNSLDVRTVGIGGGSMIEIAKGVIVNTGPRSAHIAGLPYEVFAKEEDMIDPVLKTISPKTGDPDYAYVECSNGKKYSLTLTGAANIAGYIPDGDYARGNVEAARKAWKPLADNMGVSVEDAAEKALYYAALKNGAVVKALLDDYEMDKRTTMFVGGGGGASAVVPHLAKTLGHKHVNAKNAPIISTIGVALAMVRDMVERTVPNPTEDDIATIRREAFEKAVMSGASPDTIEVEVEIIAQKNLLRAIAVGATEMRKKDRAEAQKTKEQLLQIAAENMDIPASDITVEAENDSLMVLSGVKVTKKFAIFTSKTPMTRIIDREGVIRLQRKKGQVFVCEVGEYRTVLKDILAKNTEYNEGGAHYPNLFLILGKRIANLSGMQSEGQINTIADAELQGVAKNTTLIFLIAEGA